MTPITNQPLRPQSPPVGSVSPMELPALVGFPSQDQPRPHQQSIHSWIQNTISPISPERTTGSRSTLEGLTDTDGDGSPSSNVISSPNRDRPEGPDQTRVIRCFSIAAHPPVDTKSHCSTQPRKVVVCDSATSHSTKPLLVSPRDSLAARQVESEGESESD